MTRLARLLAREPVRVRMYSVGAVLVALLVHRGLVTASDASLYVALAAAVLGIPAVEGARSRVTPVAPLRTRKGAPAPAGRPRELSRGDSPYPGSHVRLVDPDRGRT